MFARAVVARQSKNLSYRELAFSKSFEQGFAYGARCAQYGNIPAFQTWWLTPEIKRPRRSIRQGH
ncbi:hypothetical protein LNO23_21225 [Klebsiella pneumoniae subsp. pneumoniae]|nr:hypothetical protein [Klebsiella pneumoniae subsp. pneumoniae]